MAPDLKQLSLGYVTELRLLNTTFVSQHLTLSAGTLGFRIAFYLLPIVKIEDLTPFLRKGQVTGLRIVKIEDLTPFYRINITNYVIIILLM